MDECRHNVHASRTKADVIQDRFRRHNYLDALRSLCPKLDDADPGQWSSAAVDISTAVGAIELGTPAPA